MTSCLFVRTLGFMALITALILHSRSRDPFLSVRRVLVVISTLLDLRVEESCAYGWLATCRFASLCDEISQHCDRAIRRNYRAFDVLLTFSPSEKRVEPHELGKRI